MVLMVALSKLVGTLFLLIFIGCVKILLMAR